MTFRVCGEPRCPGCCVVLASIVITFHEGWAWCPVCSDQALYAQVHLRYVLNHDIMHRSSIVSHGLRFYLPQPVDGKLLNAIDQFDRLISEPDPEPAAIAAWPGFDDVQLSPATRARVASRAIRYRRTVVVPAGYEVAGVTDTDRLLLVEQIESDPA